MLATWRTDGPGEWIDWEGWDAGQEFDGGSRGNGREQSCAGAGAVLFLHDSNEEVAPPGPPPLPPCLSLQVFHNA